MIKFENTVAPSAGQWRATILGTRNPLNSWNRSDSKYDIDTINDEKFPHESIHEDVIIGENDVNLLQRLVTAGSDHSKFMRMLPVIVDITAPQYWWSEMDTYKIGTVANSCSKMHKMLARPFEINDFSFDRLPGYKNEVEQCVPDFDYDKEIWKEIEQTGYFVSNFGRIKHGKRVLAGSHHSDGYIFTNIKGDQISIHRCVANAFIPNPDCLPEVNHISGNKMDNSVNNLEWSTRKANQQHAVDNHLQPKGLSTYTGKFTYEEREEIKRLWNSGEYSRREIAKMYGVSHTCINDILNNKYLYATKVNVFETVARPIIDMLNELRDAWLRENDEKNKKHIWYAIIQLLPISYNQRRTVMLNYEVLRNIYFARSNHKLDEWHDFCAWIETLPYAKELICLEK